MKLNKVNGLYHKPRLRELKVPFLVSALLIAIVAMGSLWLLVRTYFDRPYAVEYNAAVQKSAIKIVAVGDIACSPDDVNFNSGFGVPNACQFAAVSKAVQAEKADAVVLLGDIQYDQGTSSQFNQSFVPYWRNVTTKIYPVPGNHDYGNGAREASLDGYNQAFAGYFPNAYQDDMTTPGFYALNLDASWKIIGLNSNCEYIGGCGVGSQELNWLNDQLARDPRPCTLAFWHHPLFTSGLHNEVADTSRGQDFWRSLEQSGASIVLNGHDHDYERFGKQTAEGVSSTSGVREFVVGTGGVNLRSLSSTPTANQEKGIDDHFGYLVLKLYPGRYVWQFKAVDGQILDNGTDRCSQS